MVSLDLLLCTVALLWLRRMVDYDVHTSPWIQSFTPPRPAQTRAKFKSSNSIRYVVVAHNTDSATAPPQDRSVLALTPPPHFNEIHTSSTYFPLHQLDNFKRSLWKKTCNSFTVCIVFAMAIFSTIITTPTSAAFALQPRNEPLCSTGLFEHFMEYKCTPIGDIQDEGISKELTNAEEQTTDSLLSKLGIDDTTSRLSKDKIKTAETIPTDTNMNQRSR